MKEETHIGLAKLVGNLRLRELKIYDLKILIESSIEPDLIMKEKIANDIIKVLVIPVEWLIQHTVRAKHFAVRCISEAYNAIKRNDPTWLRLMGWAFHYIADWGSPHHSPTSNSNPVLALAGGGAIVGGLLGGIANADKGLGEALIGLMKGALYGVGIMGTAGLIGLAIEHNYFEKKCNLRWSNIEANINSEFLRTKEKYILDLSLSERLLQFEYKMDGLRADCNLLSPDWIDTSSNQDFIDYMLKIAHIMDFALQIVIK